MDSSISPGWLSVVHVQCSADTVNAQLYLQMLLHVEKNFRLQEVAYTFLNSQHAFKWEGAIISPKPDAEEKLHLRIFRR